MVSLEAPSRIIIITFGMFLQTFVHSLFDFGIGGSRLTLPETGLI
jgi:hypothetical protein